MRFLIVALLVAISYAQTGTNPFTFIGKGYCKTSDTPAHLPQNRPHHCFWVDAQKATYETCTQLCMQISACIGIEVINGDRCVAYVEYQENAITSAELTQQCSNLGGNLWVTNETIDYTGGITHSSGTYLSHTGDCYSFERPRPSGSPSTSPTKRPSTTPTAQPVPSPVNCVIDDAATRASCPYECGEVEGIGNPAALHGGDACPKYLCQQGDGACPVPVDCELDQVATAATCPFGCGIVPGVGNPASAHKGKECPAYICKPGDGNCPQPVDCVVDTVATAATCTDSCGYVPSIGNPKALYNGTACADYKCQPNDGNCKLSCETPVGFMTGSSVNHNIAPGLPAYAWFLSSTNEMLWLAFDIDNNEMKLVKMDAFNANYISQKSCPDCFCNGYNINSCVRDVNDAIGYWNNANTTEVSIGTIFIDITSIECPFIPGGVSNPTLPATTTPAVIGQGTWGSAMPGYCRMKDTLQTPWSMGGKFSNYGACQAQCEAMQGCIGITWNKSGAGWCSMYASYRNFIEDGKNGIGDWVCGNDQPNCGYGGNGKVHYCQYDCDIDDPEHNNNVDCYPYNVAEETWKLMGTKLSGRQWADYFGQSVAMSADGNTVAIGASGNREGYIRMYRLSGSAWSQMGSDIQGEKPGGSMGSSVALSADGMILAAGEANGGQHHNAGTVRVFKWTGSRWQQRGSTIEGQYWELSGSSIGMSLDGDVIAIGAPHSSPAKVRVYAWDETVGDYVQRGQDLVATDNYGPSRMGHSVSLSGDGSRVICGAPHWKGYTRGQARVFQWSQGSWVPMGSHFWGYGRLGEAVAISSDGSTIAIANREHVDVYEWMDYGSWRRKGIQMNGELSLALNGDGSILAMSRRVGTNHNAQGDVRTYQWNGQFWERFGSKIIADKKNDDFGRAKALSADGSRLIVGAPRDHGDRHMSGTAFIYDFPSIKKTDCVFNATASAETCTANCGIVYGVGNPGAANGGLACPTYTCQPGDGSCPPIPNNDCVRDSNATAAACTRDCGPVPSVASLDASGTGALCPWYECNVGDGACVSLPQPSYGTDQYIFGSEGAECKTGYQIDSLEDCETAHSQISGIMPQYVRWSASDAGDLVGGCSTYRFNTNLTNRNNIPNHKPICSKDGGYIWGAAGSTCAENNANIINSQAECNSAHADVGVIAMYVNWVGSDSNTLVGGCSQGHFNLDLNNLNGRSGSKPICKYDSCYDVVCTAQSQCHTSTCSNGTCIAGFAPAGSPCNDNDDTTESDSCDGNGICQGVCPVPDTGSVGGNLIDATNSAVRSNGRINLAFTNSHVVSEFKVVMNKDKYSFTSGSNTGAWNEQQDQCFSHIDRDFTYNQLREAVTFDVDGEFVVFAVESEYTYSETEFLTVGGVTHEWIQTYTRERDIPMKMEIPQTSRITLSISSTRDPPPAPNVTLAPIQSLSPTTSRPTTYPSTAPSLAPTISAPSTNPTTVPSAGPTVIPSATPTRMPSSSPSVTPTVTPSVAPTRPTSIPTLSPTAPSYSPSISPTQQPTTELPTFSPTDQASIQIVATMNASDVTNETALVLQVQNILIAAFGADAQIVINTGYQIPFSISVPSQISDSELLNACGQALGDININDQIYCKIVVSNTTRRNLSGQPCRSLALASTSNLTNMDTLFDAATQQAFVGAVSVRLGVSSSEVSICGVESLKFVITITIQATGDYSDILAQVDAVIADFHADTPFKAKKDIRNTTPSLAPTAPPSIAPTSPTSIPSLAPSNPPSSRPSVVPTSSPTSPTTAPSQVPTSTPTTTPSLKPSRSPSVQPSAYPSTQPTKAPSNFPSVLPTMAPTTPPSSNNQMIHALFPEFSAESRRLGQKPLISVRYITIMTQPWKLDNLTAIGSAVVGEVKIAETMSGSCDSGFTEIPLFLQVPQYYCQEWDVQFESDTKCGNDQTREVTLSYSAFEQNSLARVAEDVEYEWKFDLGFSPALQCALNLGKFQVALQIEGQSGRPMDFETPGPAVLDDYYYFRISAASEGLVTKLDIVSLDITSMTGIALCTDCVNHPDLQIRVSDYDPNDFRLQIYLASSVFKGNVIATISFTFDVSMRATANSRRRLAENEYVQQKVSLTLSPNDRPAFSIGKTKHPSQLNPFLELNQFIPSPAPTRETIELTQQPTSQVKEVVTKPEEIDDEIPEIKDVVVNVASGDSKQSWLMYCVGGAAFVLLALGLYYLVRNKANSDLKQQLSPRLSKKTSKSPKHGGANFFDFQIDGAKTKVTSDSEDMFSKYLNATPHMIDIHEAARQDFMNEVCIE